ncbi:MAG TPA: hypothetical protein VFW09_10675 [Solirubrobacteraceae bacterium]|nr:hypothetical protein [Solirubrobacteraceae bacterium]
MRQPRVSTADRRRAEFERFVAESGCSLGTVKSTASRALVRLQSTLVAPITKESR